MKIGTTSVFVDDPVRAFHFYTEALALTKERLLPKSGYSLWFH
jgi:catechol 2,3-dioxygenase-like lactoylglutathione lyase family enzyme